MFVSMLFGKNFNIVSCLHSENSWCSTDFHVIAILSFSMVHLQRQMFIVLCINIFISIFSPFASGLFIAIIHLHVA